MSYKKLIFKTLTDAKRMKLRFKKTYGYTPKIFRLEGKRNKFIIIKPTGLRRI